MDLWGYFLRDTDNKGVYMLDAFVVFTSAWHVTEVEYFMSWGRIVALQNGKRIDATNAIVAFVIDVARVN